MEGNSAVLNFGWPIAAVTSSDFCCVALEENDVVSPVHCIIKSDVDSRNERRTN